MRKPIPFLLTVSASVLALASCASINQRVELDKVDMAIPVSASKSIVMAGKIVSDDAAQSKEAFTIQKEIRVPLKTKLAKFDVTEDLKKQIQGGNYNAISELRFGVTGIDDSAVQWIGFERGFGGFIAALGLAFVDISSQFPTNEGGGNYVPGIIVTGAGAGIFGLSFLHESLGSVKYSIDLSGLKLSY